MALAKKGSRKIVVDGHSYRWVFFENSGWNDITVQSNSGLGAKLVVQCMWDKFDNKAQGVRGWYSPIAPKEVSNFIRKAKIAGWNPEKLGPAFSLKIPPGLTDIPPGKILGI